MENVGLLALEDSDEIEETEEVFERVYGADEVLNKLKLEVFDVARGTIQNSAWAADQSDIKFFPVQVLNGKKCIALRSPHLQHRDEVNDFDPHREEGGKGERIWVRLLRLTLFL